MSKFGQSISIASEIASMVSALEDFDICIDKTGGYIEIDGVTIHFDDEMNHVDTTVEL